MIWTVWDLKELAEATVSREYNGWRLNLAGKPLGFAGTEEGNPPGVCLSMCFKKRPALEEALFQLMTLAEAFRENLDLEPGKFVAGRKLPIAEEALAEERGAA